MVLERLVQVKCTTERPRKTWSRKIKKVERAEKDEALLEHTSLDMAKTLYGTWHDVLIAKLHDYHCGWGKCAILLVWEII